MPKLLVEVSAVIGCSLEEDRVHQGEVRVPVVVQFMVKLLVPSNL